MSPHCGSVCTLAWCTGRQARRRASRARCGASHVLQSNNASAAPRSACRWLRTPRHGVRRPPTPPRRPRSMKTRCSSCAGISLRWSAPTLTWRPAWRSSSSGCGGPAGPPRRSCTHARTGQGRRQPDAAHAWDKGASPRPRPAHPPAVRRQPCVSPPTPACPCRTSRPCPTHPPACRRMRQRPSSGARRASGPASWIQ
jgi:hypothetical protein